MSDNAQTLILIDNSLSVSKVNREVMKLTLKYMFAHTKEGRAYCFAPFSHGLDTEEYYTQDYVGLSNMADTLNFENKDISLTDTLTEVLDEWKKGDFACRDIVIFTDGQEEESVKYDREEMFYLINNTCYPCFVVCLDQTGTADNAKTLSAIARTSEGILLHSKMDGVDAEIEKKLGDAIFAAMDGYEAANWDIYSETDETSDEASSGENGAKSEEVDAKDDAANDGQNAEESVETVSVASDFAGVGLQSENDDVLYETAKKDTLSEPITYALIGGGLFLALFAVFLSWCLVLRKKKKDELEDEMYRNMIRNRIKEDSIRGVPNAPVTNNSGDEAYHTVSLLHREAEDEGNPTRLLYEADEIGDITIEDANDPSKYFRLGTKARIVLGRRPDACDAAFEYDDSVSGRHCELINTSDRWYVKDLCSSNGTLLNGQKVCSMAQIRSGDMLRLGSLSLIVRFSK